MEDLARFTLAGCRWRSLHASRQAQQLRSLQAATLKLKLEIHRFSSKVE
jgi:hypothetical protein